MSTRGKALQNTLFSSVGLYTEYVLGMVTSIIIARHLAPAGYGSYSLVIWLVGLGVAITNSGTASAAINVTSSGLASGAYGNGAVPPGEITLTMTNQTPSSAAIVVPALIA